MRNEEAMCEGLLSVVIPGFHLDKDTTPFPR